MKSIEITVKGRVQGVGFRYFVKKTAEKHGIKGYVKNLSDGNVFIVAQGEEFKINLFIEEIKKGSPMSYVTGISVQDIPNTDYKSFFIKI